jgi:hypothetical protein
MNPRTKIVTRNETVNVRGKTPAEMQAIYRRTSTEEAVRQLLRLAARIQSEGCDESVAFTLAMKERPDLARRVARGCESLRSTQ